MALSFSDFTTEPTLASWRVRWLQNASSPLQAVVVCCRGGRYGVVRRRQAKYRNSGFLPGEINLLASCATASAAYVLDGEDQSTTQSSFFQIGGASA